MHLMQGSFLFVKCHLILLLMLYILTKINELLNIML